MQSVCAGSVPAVGGLVVCWPIFCSSWLTVCSWARSWASASVRCGLRTGVVSGARFMCNWDLGQIGPYQGAIPVGPVVIPEYARPTPQPPKPIILQAASHKDYYRALIVETTLQAATAPASWA